MRSDIVTSIVIDHNNVKWFGHGYSGVTTYNDKRFKIIEFSDYGAVIVVDKNNVKWFAGYGSIISYDDTKEDVIEKEHPYFYVQDNYGGYVNSMVVDKKNKLWLTTWTVPHQIPVIICYDGEKILSKWLYYCYSIAVDNNNNIWAGGRCLYSFDGSEWNCYNDFIQRKAIRFIYVDYDDVIWMGIYDDVSDNQWFGLVKFDKKEWTIYSTENSGLVSNAIYSIIDDHNNTKWIGTDAGVSRFDGETWTTFNTENSGLCDNKVNAIAVEKNNTIWFGTDNGVSRYTGEIITTSVDEEDEIPEELPVLHSFPNPFNPSTTIEFTLPESGFTTLSIYNISGQKVRELVADHMTAGAHSLIWDGRDDSGKAVSSGVYITRLVAGKQIAASRMLLLK